MFNHKRIFSIAEIGGNHQGDYRAAKYLVDQAIETPVDAIKLQLYTGSTLVNEKQDPQRYKHFQGFELTESQTRSLIDRVKSSNKLVGASIWHESLLKKYGSECDFLKIGSGDITDLSLVKKVASLNKPLILSTGMTSVAQLKEVLGVVEHLGNENLSILHCKSLYPVHTDELNLESIVALEDLSIELDIDFQVGYSHHHTSWQPIIWAVLKGARVLEFHFTSKEFDRMQFRDHHLSLSREDVFDLFSVLGDVSRSIGNKEISLSEAEVSTGHSVSFRKAVYVSRDMTKGEVVRDDDLVCLRPLRGICASKRETILGKIVKKEIKAFDVLSWEDFE
jgi:N-acetylneuraminate synthase/N,N'-diacetyllegionaminate synthase